MSLPDPPPAPLIDPRTYADLVAQTAKLARAYSDWAPDLKTGPDPGETLIALFGKMMVQVLARLNQVPEKHHLAFLNLVGAQLLPGQAATAPLTFKAAAAVGKEVAVPAGTRVGASTKGPGGEDLFFATVAPLAVTPAALVAVIAHAPDVDKFADLRAALLAASPLPTTLSSGAQPIEHCLFIGSELFADWAGISGITLTLVLDAPLGALPIEWRVHGPEGFTALPATVSSTAATSAIWTIQIDCPLANDLFVVNGQSGRWLQGRWTPALDAGSVNPPAITDIDLVVQRRALPIDLALTNTIPIDLGRDFAPFGERPRFNDACYFACHAAFGIPSSELTLVVTLTDAPPTGSPTPTANLVLAWEVLGADGWTELGRSGPGLGPDSDSKFDGTRAFTQSGTVTLVLPAGRSTGVCGGVANYWLRVRIVKGDYGSELTVTADASGLPVIQSATLKPPWVKSLRADVKSHRAAAALTLATLNDFSLRNHGTPSVGAPLSAFRKRQSPVSAWYLGFDQPFGGRDHGLYIDVTSAANAVPPLVWEYLDATGWQACAVEDGTYSLSQGGVVRFVRGGQPARSLRFGQSAYWLRVRLLTDSSSLAALAAITVRRLQTNTVMAAQGVLYTEKILGSSSATPGQVFALGASAVLTIALVEVQEPPSVFTIDGNNDPGWVSWHVVTDFYASGAGDRHCVFDSATGELRFGDGYHGLVPPKGEQNIRATFRAGGGVAGNVAAGDLTALQSAIPFIQGVENLAAATGGTDREPIERAKQRVSSQLRHQGRAVTQADFADLAFASSPDVARVLVRPPQFNPAHAVQSEVLHPGVVRVFLVPSRPELPPRPDPSFLRRVQSYLQARCCPSLTVSTSGPEWSRVSVTAALYVAAGVAGLDVLEQARTALNQFLHPLTGGAGGIGWPFDRGPEESDLYALLAQIPGVTYLDNLALTYDPPLVQSATTSAVQELPVRMIWSDVHQLTVL